MKDDINKPYDHYKNFLLDVPRGTCIIGSMETKIAYLGMTTGLLGAFLLATITFAFYGWIAFLVSNVAWIVNSILTKNKPLGIMQIGFTVSTILGLLNNV